MLLVEYRNIHYRGADDECSICLQLISPKEASTLDCGHKFHTSCLEKWVERSSNCPLCRQTIEAKNDFPDAINNALRLSIRRDSDRRASVTPLHFWGWDHDAGQEIEYSKILPDIQLSNLLTNINNLLQVNNGQYTQGLESHLDQLEDEIVTISQWNEWKKRWTVDHPAYIALHPEQLEYWNYLHNRLGATNETLQVPDVIVNNLQSWADASISNSIIKQRIASMIRKIQSEM